jgi:radical SAM/Cys-rich protein
VSDRFSAELQRRGIALPPRAIDTLQLNITRRCNQACRHCHVDASPARTEMLSPEGVAACLDVLERQPQIGTLDLTGGAPELHPQFTTLVERARALGRRVIVRHNLTVQFDGDPATKQPMDHLPAFFAAQRVEVVSSLPYWQEYFTDAQRGSGVFGKSIEALKRLNAVGYGIPGSGLVLNLVYNPVGPYLPAPQADLERDYRKALGEQFGVQFSGLFTITNMPIHRFRLHLQKSGQYAAYMDKLLAAFNPAAADNVMCRDLISVDHRGWLYDCDFNQQLDLPLQRDDGSPETIFDFDPQRLLRRQIRLDDHCLGCSAGGGSSCGGATA